MTAPAWPAGLAAAVEAALTGASAPGGPFDPAVVARLDAAEEFPAAACALLDACGAARAYVPAELGGAPGGLPELVAVLRAVARRDVTAAVAHGKTYLGSAPTWVAGTPEQRTALARAVLEERAVVSWGLTEPGHGSDLLAGRLTAAPAGGEAPASGGAVPETAGPRPGAAGGWRLDGVKWPVNNATRGRMVSVLARTDPTGHPRGFSVFLVDKERLAPGAARPLPKEPTHGIRGADISGVRLTGARVGAEALTGRVGEGLEIVLRALQLTRTVCTALSLGAGEHALRLAYGFAAGRAMYGTVLLRLPAARRVLGRAAAGLELADAASLLAARCAHGLTGEMSVVSALAKAGVPEIVQGVLDDLAELLGARGFLTGVHAHGMFQKLERDHRVVAVFDGTTAVNRAALIGQFRALAARFHDGGHDAAGLARALDGAALPPLDTAALRLSSATGCSVVQALPSAAARLAGLAGGAAVPARAGALARALAAETAEAAAAMAAIPPGRGAPTEAYALARRYELCFAGACAVHLLAAAPGDAGRAVRLTAALERCLELLVPGWQTPPDAYEPLLAALESAGGDRSARPGELAS